jgi:quercetin dioxygenase-like cupin family protein
MSAASTAVIHAGPIEIRFLVDADDSGGSVTVFECRVPPSVQTPAPHSHDAFEETIYGLEGVSTWTIDGQAREIGPGQAVCIPRGSIHGFANHGSSAAMFLAVATPGLFGPAYFRDIGEVVAAAQGGPPDLAAIGEVMRRHGLTPASPETPAPDAPEAPPGPRLQTTPASTKNSMP